MINPIRDYAWGSTTVLARLQGRRPTGEPEAELWMGAHSSAPSRLIDPNGVETRLDAAIVEHGVEILGRQVHQCQGNRLPFLLKILAIAEPLSVQVHPTAERARRGYEGSQQPLGDHEYVDPYAKPEMLYALEPIDAMCGFRTVAEVERLLGLLDGPRVELLTAVLTATGDAHPLEHVLRTLVSWAADDRVALVADVVKQAHRLLTSAGPLGDSPLSAEDRRALNWVCRIGRSYPEDPLVVGPFVLDLVRLEPGEVLFVPPGTPHAYLFGLGVEIMANSDNVLRAGLTHKHVAVEEMLHVVQGERGPDRDVPFAWLSPHEVIWAPPVQEFQLGRIWMTDTAPVTCFPGIAGPQILLCTSGPVQVSSPGQSLTLSPGESAFVGAGGAGTIVLSGPGEVFRASAGGQRLPRSA